jgi:hypothetical protein
VEVKLWWYLKPSSQRQLIKYGTGTAILLLVLGFLFDFGMTKQTYEEYPFITSIPKDLFKLVIIGTVSVVFLDELRASWRALPELRGLFPEAAKSSGDVVEAITRALGIGERASMIRSLYGAASPSSLSRISSGLYRVGSVCTEVASDTEAEESSTDEGRSAWLVMTHHDWEMPQQSDIDALKNQIKELADDLSEIRPLVSPDKRERIGRLRAELADASLPISAAQAGLRTLLSQSTMKKEEMRQLGLSLMHAGNLVGAIEVLLFELESDIKIDLSKI